MVGVTVSAYIHGLLIDRFRGGIWSKVFLWSSVITGIGVLGFFKYSDFFITNLNAMTNADRKLLGLALPIGISFYTFQTLSYTIDVYRGEAKVQKDFISLATYVTLFTQLIAGPIVRYSSVEKELSCRTHSWENAAYGINRFLIGLSKKVLIADILGALADSLHKSGEVSVAGYWLYALAVTLQLYFDFSGYSDMAIGLGRIFGFHFPENFRYPFMAGSISEFWRRWHMTLGTWFRDYVYIPLGGNRVSFLRWLFNVILVWFLTGLWHGADWTFVLWGLYFAAFLILEKICLNRLLAKIPDIFAHFYVIITVMFSFVLFSAEGLTGARKDLGGMFGIGGIPLWTGETGFYLSSYLVILVIAMVGATPIPKKVVMKLQENKTADFVLSVLEPVFHVVIALVVTAYLVDGSFSPFLYFRF
ncbi:MAG: MBOAT family O-acyltransferase [Lachnospiraceae bacterium]